MTDPDAVVALGSASVLSACTFALSSRPRWWERRVFALVNRRGNPTVLRVPQQLGTPWSLPATGAFLWVIGRRREAVAAALALPVEKAAEVRIKKALERRRPLLETPTILHDDAPREGPPFPSGHAAIVAASAYLLARAFPVASIPLVAASWFTSIVRVHQGAHWPSDVLAGGALGVCVASALRWLVEPD